MGPIIQANIDKAFCLVEYNAEETDKQKQETLLKEVVNQVLALSYGKKDKEDNNTEDYAGSNVSSLARMLFLLNRVDAFCRDKDPVASLEKFKKDITGQIQEKLKRALPEHQETIEKIDLAQISSLLALLAVEADRLWERPEEQVKVLKEIEKKFQPIFPDDYFEEFPRNYKDLTEEQRRSFISEALKYSYGNVFETHLSEHISKNLLEIIIGGHANVMCLAYNRLSDILCSLLESETSTNSEMYAFGEYILRQIDKFNPYLAEI